MVNDNSNNNHIYHTNLLECQVFFYDVLYFARYDDNVRDLMKNPVGTNELTL